MLKNGSGILLVLLSSMALSCGSSNNGTADAVADTNHDSADAAPADSSQDLGRDLEQELTDDAADTQTKDSSDSDSEDVEEIVEKIYPDPSIINKFDMPPVVSAQDQYVEDETVQYFEPDKLPTVDVQTMKVVSGTLFVGTTLGLYKYDAMLDKFIAFGPASEYHVVDIASTPTSDGYLVIATSTGIARIPLSGAGNSFAQITPPEAGSTLCVATSGTTVYFGTTTGGLYSMLPGEPPTIEPVPEVGGEGTPEVRDVEIGPGNTIYMATPVGVRLLSGDEVSAKTAADSSIPDDNVRALFADPASGVWAATEKGVARLTGTPYVATAGVGLLPAEDNISVAVKSGIVALGHTIGATRFVLADGGPGLFESYDHFLSKRFLPGNRVNAVVYDSDGNLWFGTDGGAARLKPSEHTLAEKEDYHHQMLVDHFWRMDGFVASDAGLASPNDFDSPWRTWDKDNDGLWTQMQIGAWCYAYSVTKDERYYEAARKAMENMFMLVDLPAIDFEKAGWGRGFISRSLVREDEGPVFEDKKTQSNWHLVEWEGKEYYWKDDTSSDEITGHMFGFPLFYDLCAKTDEEKQEVASYAADVVRFIMKHGFILIDLDGEKTTHGHWNPEHTGLAVEGFDKCVEQAASAPNFMEIVELCADSYYGGGWLNSVEILGFLLAAYHMTGDKEFYDAYDDLVVNHHYDIIATPHEETLTITSPGVMNHSDHELAMLAYHTLLRYEPNQDRRQLWEQGFRFFYDYERVERNPLWAGFASVLLDEEPDQVAETIVSLQQMPFDRREWAIDNSHRKDAKPWPLDRHDNPQVDTVFPYDEIRVIWWNGNFHGLIEGGNGTNVSGPMAWLLPYWALRYSGAISE